MPDDEDIALSEKRMFGQRRTETVSYVAAEQGVATVRSSGDQIGRLSLDHGCRARDVAAVDGRVAVAAEQGVLLGPDPFESVGFGGAVAVGFADGAVVAANADGRVARHDDGEWATVGTVADARAIDGSFVAAAGGVFRIDGGRLAHAGLEDVRDVAAGETPLAATGDGLYRLGAGWMRERDGVFTTVASDGDRAHAATDSALYERARSSTDDGDADAWRETDLPVDEHVVDVGYGQCVYAVTGDGTFLVDADPETTPDGAGGWRSRSIGLPGVSALAVV